MTDPSELSDEELLVLARDWRREALRGALHARGYAHAYEVEFRRRMGATATLSAPLDTRPLAARSRPWWRFW
jgi:hypothetical protein